MDTTKKQKRSKIIKIIALILLVNLLADAIITKLVYDSIFRRYDPAYEEVQAFRDPVLEQMAQPVSFYSGDQLLRGRYFDSEGDSLVVIAQGLNSYMESHYPTIAYFTQQAKRDVLIFDMTGSSESEGESLVGFSQAVSDLHAALDHIHQTYSYEDIYLYGHSRGAYAVCCVLQDREDIDGVVAINGPNSPMEAVVGSASNYVGWLAYCNYPMLWLYQTILFDAETVALSASDIICHSDVPVLIIQASEDTVVPPDRNSIYSHRDAVTDSDTQFFLTQGGHSSVLTAPDGTGINQPLMAAIDAFYQEAE